MIAVSSWAVHDWLLAQPEESRWPAFFRGLRDRGIDLAEICHFHLPDGSAVVTKAASDAGVRLQTLLIDDGDLTSLDEGASWETWIAEKLRLAESMGFERARIIAGKTSGDGALQRGIEAGRRLAEGTQVRVTTENWFGLLASPATVNEYLDLTDGAIGLCADFGNWPMDRKYDDLPSILPRAETIHAKADFGADGIMDEEGFARCLDLALAAGFSEPYVLVAGGWSGVESSAAFVRERVANSPVL
ncbi:hypothetical protein BH11ARM2_BH11ARM2_05480 [soil metagenome]